MDVAAVASFLRNFIQEVPDESLLEYLVKTLRSKEPSQEEKDDLLYSLLPELGLLDDFAKSSVSQALSGSAGAFQTQGEPSSTSSSSSRSSGEFGFSTSTNESQQPQQRPQPQSQPHELDTIKVELQEFLEALNLGDVATTVESEIIGYLLSAFQGSNLDPEERRALIQSYIFGPTGIIQDDTNEREGEHAVSEDSMESLSSFFELKAEEQKDEETARMTALSQGRAADIQNSLQYIVSEQRRKKSVVSEEEALERAKLVKNFGDEEVLPKYDEKGKETKPISSRSPILFVANPKKESKIRYRDGQVVSKSGGKYIIEKVEEEYDSGARGRVKGKGKRGAGVGKGI